MLKEGFGEPSKSLTEVPRFELPAVVKLEEYPHVIRELKKFILKTRMELEELERARNSRFSLLKSTEWKRSGTNNEERDAAFQLILEQDETYRAILNDCHAYEWAIREMEADVDFLENEFSVKKLKYRSAVVHAELFGGIPVTE